MGVLKCIVNITPHHSSSNSDQEVPVGSTSAGAKSGKKHQLAPIKLVEEEVKVENMYIYV